MNDAERVRAIERKAELRLLEDVDRIVWADELPLSNAQRAMWATAAYELAMTRPGKWLRVRGYANASTCSRIAQQIKRPESGRISTPPPGNWDAATRKDGSETWLWIKFEPLDTVDNPQPCPQKIHNETADKPASSTRTPQDR